MQATFWTLVIAAIVGFWYGSLMAAVLTVVVVIVVALLVVLVCFYLGLKENERIFYHNHPELTGEKHYDHRTNRFEDKECTCSKCLARDREYYDYHSGKFGANKGRCHPGE